MCYWLLQRPQDSSLSSTHLQTPRYSLLLLGSRRHVKDTLFPPKLNHSSWFPLSNPTGNCLNHSKKLRNETFGGFLPSLTWLSNTKCSRESTCLWVTIWELWNAESRACRCPQPRLQVGLEHRDGSAAFPHAKRKVLALLWMDACAWIIQCFPSGCNLYNTKQGVFPILTPIQITFSTESYTLKRCCDKCNSDALKQQLKFVPKGQQTYFFFFYLIHILDCRNLNALFHTTI